MTDAEATQRPPHAVRRVVGIAIAILFGLLFAFYLYELISQAVQLEDYLRLQNPVLKKAGHVELVYPWVAIAPLLLLPFVTFTIAFVIGRRRTVLVRVVLFVMGFAVLASGSLTLESLASQLTRIT